uniref:DUF2314 domain-containing protein n=1 Tax=uncultured Verrucomicrobiota bacterium TaxID=156588 RepID=D2DXX4_9BACT|nr:hypothetical protein [uncultured Verrucomicrobiota bacterium]
MRRAFLIAVASLVAVTSLGGCVDKAKEARRKELIELMHGNTDDADIKTAIAKARATVPEFLSALQKPAANQGQFIVRKSFPRKDGKQQILWVTGLTYDGTLLHGKVDDNTAQPGGNIPKDGTVSFKPEEISDWMYNEGGLAVGGHMLRALKKKLSEDEWERGLGREIKAFKE